MDYRVLTQWGCFVPSGHKVFPKTFKGYQMSTYQPVDDYFDSDLYPSMLSGEQQEMPMLIQLQQDWNTLSGMLFATIRVNVLRMLFWFLKRTYAD